jgi:hypothetical protein
MNEMTTKDTLFNIVFAEDNTHNPNYTLNTTHLSVSVGPHTDHITSSPQYTAYSSKGWTGMKNKQ